MYSFTSHDTLLLVEIGDDYLEEPNCNAVVDRAKQWRAPIKTPTFWSAICDYGIMETIIPNVLLIVISILNQGKFKLLLTDICL